MRKTARITDRSGLWHRFALYREATMLADLQAHYGPNETARFHGICDATDISIVMDKLDDVQARWLSCLLEKARTSNDTVKSQMTLRKKKVQEQREKEKTRLWALLGVIALLVIVAVEWSNDTEEVVVGGAPSPSSGGMGGAVKKKNKYQTEL